MEDVQKKKGMSKGCLIGLIIVGAIVVIIIIGGITCWIYKDDLAKMGATTAINGLKQELIQNQVDGVDTTQFNALADAFVTRLGEDETLDLQKYGLFMQSIQNILGDQDIDQYDVKVVMDAMVDYYPELKDVLPAEEEEPVEIPDTLEIE